MPRDPRDRYGLADTASDPYLDGYGLGSGQAGLESPFMLTASANGRATTPHNQRAALNWEAAWAGLKAWWAGLAVPNEEPEPFYLASVTPGREQTALQNTSPLNTTLALPSLSLPLAEEKVERVIDAHQGGTLITGDGSAQVVFAPDGLPDSIRVSTGNLLNPNLPVTFIQVGAAFEVDGLWNTTKESVDYLDPPAFESALNVTSGKPQPIKSSYWATVQIELSSDQDFPAEQIAIARLDSASGKWEILETGLSEDGSVFIAQTDRLTAFALVFVIVPTPAAFEALNAVEVIVDESDPGFQAYEYDGTIDFFWPVNCTPPAMCHDGDAIYTLNKSNEPSPPGVDWNWGTWTPLLPLAGDYSVLAFIPTNDATTAGANYQIHHNDTTDNKVVEQNSLSGVWTLLGLFDFSGDGSEYVYLGDVVPETSGYGSKIAYDAIKFVEGIVLPPEVEILQSYGNDLGNGRIEVSVLVRITAGSSPIVNKTVTVSSGLVKQQLAPYFSPSYNHGPDVFAATFDYVPGRTKVTFFVQALDANGIAASDSFESYYPDTKSFGSSSCGIIAPNGSVCPNKGFQTNTQNPVMTYDGQKGEKFVIPLTDSFGEIILDLMLAYNSNSIRIGIFGGAFSSEWETHLVFLYNPLVEGIEVVIGDGGRFRFHDNGDGTFTPESQGNADTLIKDGSDYLYTTARTQITYRFDADGRLLEKFDRNGNAVTYGYTNDQLTSISTGGRTVTLTYNADGYVETLSIGGKTITITYDGDALVGIQDANGGSWVFEYEIRDIGEIVDERGEEFAYFARNYYLTKVTTPDGRVKNEQTYDAEGRVDFQTSTIEGTLDFEYIENADGSSETHITDAYGKTEIHYYNSLGQLVQKTNRAGESEYYEYNADFFMTKKTDFAGNVWAYTRDANGNITETFGPEGYHVRWEYNSFNDPTLYVDPDGFEWRWEYDPNGNLTSIIQPDGTYATIAYDSRGLPVTICDFNAVANNTPCTTNAYDPISGDLLSTTDPEGSTTTFTHDEYGRRASMTLPSGDTYTYTYDLNDNLTAVDGPLGYHTEYEYDADDLLVREQDADGNDTVYEYDENAQLIRLTNAEGETYRYTYGDARELTGVMDPRGAVTGYQHDDLYRVTQVDMPESVTLQFEYDKLGNVTFATDGEGRVTATTYDGLSRPFAVVQNYIEGVPSDADTNVVTLFEFDQRGNVTQITNPLGGVQEFAYDSVGRLISSENEADEATGFGYDPNGNLTRTQFPEGNAIEAEYNGRNQPSLLRDGALYETELTYDANGNLFERVDADGIITRYGYNALDQQTSVTENYAAPGAVTGEQNVTTTFEYSLAGDLTKVIDANNAEFTFAYDGAHRLVHETNPEGEIGYTYDDVGNLTETLDANQHAWANTYDFLNRLTSMTNPEGHSASFVYDQANNRIEATDPRQFTTYTEYDALNRPVSVTDPMGYVTQMSYDALGNLLALTDGNGHTTSFDYDVASRLITRTDAEGFRVEFEYDLNGRLTLQRIPFADPDDTIEETFAYDGRNLRTAATNGMGETVEYSYNAVGLLELMTENDDVVTLYQYDGLRRLDRVTLNYLPSKPATGSMNVAYNYTYDGVGNLVSILDPLNHETIFDYNALGSLVYEKNATGSEWFYAYDPAQNLIHRTDANEQETFYSYYPDNQLQAVDYPDDTDVTYTYDENNNPTGMTDGLGATSWVHDPLNRVTSVTDSLGRTVGYSYDAVNRRSVTYPDGLTVSYGYLDNDWLATVTDPVGGESLYTRDAAGRVTRVEHPNSTYSTRTYDRASRLLELANYQVTNNGDDVLSKFNYLYDAAGQRVQATNEYGWRNPSVVVENYTYDNLRRLTGVTDSEGLAMSYRYDRAGNRTQWKTNDDPFTSNPNDAFTANYKYDAANRLTKATITRQPASQSQTITYRYDPNGNRIDKLVSANGVKTGMGYTYDDENRLVSGYAYLVTGRKINWQDETRMGYDGGGRRLVETYDPHGAGTGGLKRTEYTFDGLDPIAEFDQWDGQQRNYYRGDGNELIQLHHFPSGTPGQQYWYHQNGHGDVAGLTKQSGQSTHNYRYDAYGGVIPDNGNFTAPHNDYTLTGKAWDGHTGLYYFGARYLDPMVGGWVTQDTYRGEYARPLSLHRYGYVEGNPVNYFDVFGFKYAVFVRGIDGPINYFGDEKGNDTYWKNSEAYNDAVNNVDQIQILIFCYSGTSSASGENCNGNPNTISSKDAAKKLYGDIMALNDPDVTIYSHSKGSNVVEYMLANYPAKMCEDGGSDITTWVSYEGATGTFQSIVGKKFYGTENVEIDANNIGVDVFDIKTIGDPVAASECIENSVCILRSPPVLPWNVHDIDFYSLTDLEGDVSSGIQWVGNQVVEATTWVGDKVKEAYDWLNKSLRLGDP